MSGSPPKEEAPNHASEAPTKLSKAAHARSFFNTRQSSMYKWQRNRDVVGVLEVESVPVLRYRGVLTPQCSPGREKSFQAALEAWKDLELRKEFIEACDELPATMCCCGLMQDDDETIKDIVPLLNANWCRKANKKLIPHGMKIDVFLWNWQNASGKAETNIMLIRFRELSSYRYKIAKQDSQSSGENFDLLPQDGSQDMSIEIEPSEDISGELEMERSC